MYLKTFFLALVEKVQRERERLVIVYMTFFYATRFLLLLYFFSLRYQGNFSTEIKRDVRFFFFLKKLAEKIVPNGACLLFVY